jgi:hypothetical protein
MSTTEGKPTTVVASGKNRGYVSNSKKPLTTGIPGINIMDNQQQRY